MAVDTGIDSTLRGVWLSTRLDFEIVGDLDSAWAVGDNGTVLRWNGTNWQSEASGTNSDLYAVAGNHSQNTRAVGENGTVIRRRFGNWVGDIQTPANDVTLRSIITSASNEAWASGDNGTLWFANGFGANFTPLDSGTSDTLNGVIRRDSRNYYSAGDAGRLVSDSGRLAATDIDAWQQDSIGSTDHTVHGLFSLPYGALRIPNPATDVSIRESTTGETVMTVPLELRSVNDFLSGEDVYSFDFSHLTTPGIYEAYVPGIGVSDEFVIGDDVYQAAAVAAGKSFYYQRSGTSIDEPFSDFRFARHASHEFSSDPNAPVLSGWYHPSVADSPLYNGESVFQGDVEAPAPNAFGDPGTVVDLDGGWFDAGDYGRYIPSAVDALWHLITAYDIDPSRFPDGLWDIPESGNGISDLLDEIRYETD